MSDPHEIFGLDRRAVARAFDRASAGYDAAAALQQRVRDELLGRLEELKVQPRAVLDLGAGTGHATRALKRRYPQALTVAVDIAPGMLERARAQSRWLRRFERVRADAYSLPFRDQSFDVVFSSLMLQWCDDLDAVFAELSRVLAPGGLLLFSTFGPGTLGELREAWAASDAQSENRGNHVNHFFDPHALGSALMHAGFAEPVLDVDRIVMTYPDTFALMRELKAIGAHNVTRGRPRGLTGRARLDAMSRAYETQRRDGLLPATYEVIHAVSWGGERRGEDGFPRETYISPGSIRKRGQI
ncbi:MAG TPA: malonyl-ACP O-methyltransferase BioC [Steroidobacteraceae bacterium]|nr:malonyl-ACP O-methyltransferase BioC [Steroidobacteraceae bacterium]